MAPKGRPVVRRLNLRWEVEGRSLVLDAHIRGHKISFTLDSRSPVTSIPKNFLDLCGLRDKYFEKQQLFVGYSGYVGNQKVTFQNGIVLNPYLGVSKNFDAQNCVLGADILMSHNATIVMNTESPYLLLHNLHVTPVPRLATQVPVTINGKTVMADLDTGSTSLGVTQNLINELNLPVEKLAKPVMIIGASHTEKSHVYCPDVSVSVCGINTVVDGTPLGSLAKDACEVFPLVGMTILKHLKEIHMTDYGHGILEDEKYVDKCKELNSLVHKMLGVSIELPSGNRRSRRRGKGK